MARIILDRKTKHISSKADLAKLLEEMKSNSSDDYCKECSLLKEQCSWMLRQSNSDRALIAAYWLAAGLPGQVIIQWGLGHDLKPSEFLDKNDISNRVVGFKNE